MLIGVLDRVAGEVPQRLSEPVRIGVQRPVGDRPELEPAIRGQAHAVPDVRDERAHVDLLGAQEVGPLGLGEHQQVVDEPRDPRDLGQHQPLDAIQLGARRVLLGGEHLELPADDRERRAQLVRSVGDERALAGERLGETVEHPVERLGQDPDLVAAVVRDLHPRPQIAGIDAGRRPAPSAAAAPTPGRPARYDANSASNSTTAPASTNARATPFCARSTTCQRLRRARDDRDTLPTSARSLEDPHLPDVRHLRGRVAEVRDQQLALLAFSICCSASLSPSSGAPPPNSSG